MTAASVALWTLLAGPRRPARVLDIDAGAVHLWIEPLAAAQARDGRDHPGAVVALLEPDAVRLPIGIVLPPAASALVPVSVAGSPVSRGEIHIGWGAITLAEARFSVLDWWNPGIPVLPRPVLSITSASSSAPSSAPDAGADSRAESAGWAEPLAIGLAALASGDAERAVHHLIGVGGGLIPIGDDVLVGALAALAAWAPDSPDRAALAQATAAALSPARPSTSVTASAAVRASATSVSAEVPTTPVSAALLQSAATGFATPEVIDYLTALSLEGRPEGLPVDSPGVDQARARLAAIGIGSGGAIALGIHHQLRALPLGSTE